MADYDKGKYYKFNYHNYYRYRKEEVLEEINNHLERILKNYNIAEYLSYYDERDFQYHLMDSIKYYLEYGNDDLISYFASKAGTTTEAVKEFFLWLENKHSIKGNYRKIPYEVLLKYVNDFEGDYYQKNYRVSASQAKEVANAVRRAFMNSTNSDYFDKLTKRYRFRTATYKCVFLSTDASFYDLIENKWNELNEYTGDYLDIFYKLDEFKEFSGYSNADKLLIRARVTKFPCIYLWQTALDEGTSIPIDGLDMDSLFQLIKGLVDLIVQQKTMDEIIESANELSDLLRLQLTKNEEIEKNVLEQLQYACITLQQNPVTFGNVDENQKNTQIRDLMCCLYNNPSEIAGKTYRIEIMDQPNHGLSSTRISYGRPDLIVKIDNLPFCIIEGIEIKTERQGVHWNRSDLFRHINRLGNYDQNGLERNVIIVYAKTDCFDSFCKSLFTSINDNPRVRIKNSNISILEEVKINQEYSALRIIKGTYLYNERERSLFFFVVHIDGNERGANA